MLAGKKIYTLTGYARADLRRPALVLLMLGLVAAIGASDSLRGKQNTLPQSAALYAAEPGGELEAQERLNLDAYWHARYAYPTGRADRAWLMQAAKDDQARVRNGVPAGRVIYQPGGSAANSQSPLVLSPTNWTSIGPQPQDSNTCEVCFPFGIVAGRINDIVVDPTSSAIAYIGSDGGGVWKTNNCCSAATTWQPVTDGPLISSVAIGDLEIASNGTVYAGTGDLRYGSFSFGSAGLLKSTDQGATWQIKGADVFGMAYPQPPGSFPQYDSIGKVAVRPTNSNHLAVGTKQGMWFSYDGGDNWSGPCLTNPYQNQRQDITALLALPGAQTELFAAVGSRGYSTTVQINLAENGANGIYKTTWPNSGCPAGWTLMSRPDNGWPPGTGSGIPQYQAGGNQVGRIDMAFAPSNPNYIYAEVQAINPGFGALQRGGLLGVWRSTDRGATWVQKVTAQDLEDAQDECGGSCVGGDPLALCGDLAQNWYDQDVEVDPNNPDHFYFNTINIWKSEDGGDTVRDVTCGYSTIQVPRPVHVDQHAVTFLPGSSSQALFGNDGGVYFSPSANLPQPTFIQLNTTLSTIEFYGGDISANFATSPNPFAVAGAQDNGSSSWTAVDPSIGPYLWQQRIGGDGMFARIEPVLGQNVYMEAQNGALRLSTSGHQGPYPLLSAATNFNGDRLSFIWPYEIYKGVPATVGPGEDCPPTGCTHLIGGTFRVWENVGSALANSPWYVNSPRLTKDTLGDRSFINQLAYAYRTDDLAIAGTNDGNVAVGYNMGRGTANSATWTDVTGGNAVLPNRPILDVALGGEVVTSTTGLVGYAAVGGFDQNTPGQPGHVFRLTCGPNVSGCTWANKSGNLPNIPVNAIAVNPRFPQQVFAGSDWGVYYTNDVTAASPVWYRFNAGMPNVMIWDFAVDRGFTTLAAFTRSRGAYVWPLPAGPLAPPPTPTGTPPTPTNTPMTRTPIVPPSYTPGPPNTPTHTFTPQPTPTQLACGSTLLFGEGFESGTLGGFTASQNTGPQPWRAVNTIFRSGGWSAHVPNNAVISDQRLTMTNPVTVPASATSAQMQFYHRFFFEDESTAWDGGVLEFSTDGGATWVDAGTPPNNLITEGGYNGVVTTGALSGNPLAGRPAWVNRMPGHPAYQRVTVDLTSFIGESVQFRLRHGSDEATGAEGWYVDDVVIISTGACHTATPTNTPTATPTPDFALSVSPTSQTVRPSRDAVYTVTVTSLNGFSGNVTLSEIGHPSNSTITFQPNPVAVPAGGSAASTLTIRTKGNTPEGTYTLTITGVNGERARSQQVTLIVGR